MKTSAEKGYLLHLASWGSHGCGKYLVFDADLKYMGYGGECLQCGSGEPLWSGSARMGFSTEDLELVDDIDQYF